ncbi:MAG: hypothetical protein AB7U20_05250 [Planctomycetaceae bacterium]
MSTKPLPPNPSDDDLESLAEDLLGIDLHSSLPEVEPFEVEEFDLEEGDDEIDAPAAELAEAPDTSSSLVSKESTSIRPRRTFIDDDDDFGSALFDEEEEPGPRVVAVSPKAERRIEPPKEDLEETLDDDELELAEADDDELELAEADDDEPELAEADDDEPELAEMDEADAAVPEEDTYWDALDGWDWEEETSTSSGEKAKPRSVSERPAAPRSENRVSEPQRKTTELRADSDFGAGLDETAATRRVEEQEEAPSRRRSRRRRRRSGPGAGREAAAPDRAVDATPAADAKPERDDESGWEEEPEVSDDGFGAGLEVGEESREEPRKRGRSRRRRRRPADRKASESVAAPDEPVEPEEVEARETRPVDSDEADRDEGPDQERKYRNVPTWEEAIGYLVRPSGRRSGTEGGSSEGQRRGGRGRSGSRRGGGGRRGGGKSSGS